MTQFANSPDWLTEVFDTHLEPLVHTASGIPVWRIADDQSQATISAQFQANAGEYNQRYSASDHFEGLFRQAFERAAVELPAVPRILDLGSGSGANSVLPCLRLFPGAEVIATDLSGELLAILAEHLPTIDAQDRVACVVMDAMSSHVRPGAFDLVTGVAILHHLLTPREGVRAAARALRPGGKAIFFEPFDGYGLMAIAYRHILGKASWPFRRLDKRLADILRGMEQDIAARTLPDITSPNFAFMDDKWLFSQEHIAKMAEKCGFSKVEFIPHMDHSTMYRDVADVQIRLAAGSDELKLPVWALEVLDGFDRAIPPMTKRRIMLEGTIVMTKGD